MICTAYSWLLAIKNGCVENSSKKFLNVPTSVYNLLNLENPFVCLYLT